MHEIILCVVFLRQTRYLVNFQPKTTEHSIMSALSGSDEELDRLRKVLVEAIDEAKTKSSRQRE